jgi:RecA-family ATPase
MSSRVKEYTKRAKVGASDNGKTLKTLPLPPMVSARDLCANPPLTPPEIIEGILYQGGKMVIGGESKSFKTWILLHLATCISTGREWLGFPTTQSRVLYVNFELPEFAIQKRIREICDAMHIEVPENLMLWNLRASSSKGSIGAASLDARHSVGPHCRN